MNEPTIGHSLLLQNWNNVTVDMEIRGNTTISSAVGDRGTERDEGG